MYSLPYQIERIVSLLLKNLWRSTGFTRSIVQHIAVYLWVTVSFCSQQRALSMPIQLGWFVIIQIKEW